MRKYDRHIEMKIIDNKKTIIIKKSVALLLIAILFLSTIEALENPLQSQYAQAISPSQKPQPQPTNPLLKNSTSNSTPNNMTQGIVIAKNVKSPVSVSGTLLRTIGIKNLPPTPGNLNRTFPLGPLPLGDIPEVIQAKKNLKIPPTTPQRPTIVSQPPSNFTANSNLFNKTTLFNNNVGIRELGAFLLDINKENITQYAKNITRPAVKIHTSDPLFVNSVAGFKGLTKCTTLPAPGGGTVTRCSWPPDVQMAVGPSHIFELVNQVGKIFTKHGSSVSTFFLSSFFGTNTNDDLTDPRVMYDTLSGRWFASIADFTTVSVILAVSTSSDPTVTPGGWKIYNFPFNNCPDQPKIGFSDDKLAVSANIFTANPTCQASLGSFLGLQYYIISKNDLINGVATPRQQRSNIDNTIFAVNPVQSLSSTSTLFMVTVGSQQSTTVVLSSVSGTVPNAVRTDTALSISTTHQPSGARQPTTSVQLDTDDARILDAAWYQGRLWFTFNDGCTPSGDTQIRSCFRLDQIDTTTNSLVLPELEKGTTGFDYFYPALRIDGTRNVDVLFGYSSLNNYPSLAVTGVAVGTQTMDSPVNFVVGSGPDTQDCNTTPPCNPVRYGDYFGAGLDPADSSIIWAAGEYHTSSPDWSTFIGEMTRTNVWSGFSPLGGLIIGDPAVGRNADGRLEVFVVGTDHAVYHKFQTIAGSNSWSGFARLGGYVISNPVVGQDADGRLEVFAVGSDHAVWHNEETSVSNSNSYSGFISLGGNIVGDPAVARNTDGTLELFVVEGDKHLYHNFQSAANSNNWVGFSSLGGIVILDPVVAQNEDGRLEVFVIGSDNGIWHKFQTSPSSHLSYSGFFSLGGVVIKDPAVGLNTDGRLEVFAVESNNALYHNAQTSAGTNSWTGFYPLGGSIIRKPAVAQNEDGRLEVFVIGTDNALYYNIQSTIGSFLSYSGFVSLFGNVISDPIVAQNSDKRLEVFVIVSNNSLWHIFQLS